MAVFLLILAFVMGFAVRRGQTCAVLAVREVMERRRFDRFWSFISCAAWAAVAAIALVWSGRPGVALAPRIDLTVQVAAGGALFGFGAAVNGACAFGTLSRIVSGNTSFLFVLPGMAAGAFILQNMPLYWLPHVAGPNPLGVPSPAGFVAVVLALAIVGRELVVMRRGWVSGKAFVRRLLWRFWTPATAMAVIGVSGGLLYAFGPKWSYGSAIDEIVATAAIGRAVVLDQHLVALICATLAGGIAAAWLRNEFALGRPRFDQVGASLAGGALMGVGGGLIPGGNDGIVLYALPGFVAYGAVAYIAMNLAIALAMWMRTRLAGPMTDPFPAEE